MNAAQVTPSIPTDDSARATATGTHTNVAEARWRAVLARDRREDGRFVYAVNSTGIFCRPSCPSRRPRRERVRFFDTPVDAVAGGFRACRRCRPLDAADDWTRRVARACELIAHAPTPPSLAALARHAHSTPHHFLRRFKAIVGMTPRELAAARRFAVVKQQLKARPDVTTAVFEAGYGSSSRFYERAASRLGMAPAVYRAGGRGQTISYTTADSSLGRVIVAATPRGICAVSFGGDDTTLLDGLRAEYPEAALERAAGPARDWVARVIAAIDGRRAGGELPLDVRATAFQWQVWKALQEIPWGQTRTYAEVAAAIGRPTAARAVARACAGNRVAVVIPCHRVVPAAAGPDSGGYRWGRARKQALLQREREGGEP